MKLLLLLVCFIIAVLAEDKPDYQFPEGFIFGVSTAAFQIEGGWNEDGKGESIWDHSLHQYPGAVKDGTSADIACDSYHKYKEDIQCLKELGVDFYRFSISWPRIMPDGKADNINQAGVDYYNDLIDELIANDIQPVITMYNLDLPQALQREGGLPNADLADYFVDYARFLFGTYGDRVKYWFTFNELFTVCQYSYGLATDPPFVRGQQYECAHTVLLAHARSYRLYESEFRETQKGQVGVVLDAKWYEPRDPENESDVLASEMYMEMTVGWFANPLVYGTYSEMLIKLVPQLGLTVPEFTPEQQELLKGSFDYIGLNQFTAELTYFINDSQQLADLTWTQDPSWPSTNTPTNKVTPWGIRSTLVWLKKRYENPPIFITGNGFAGNGTLEDYARADFYKEYMYAVLEAIYEDECTVLGFAAWTLMDNFEWAEGYTLKFGLYYTNFTDPELPRVRKLSTYVFSDIVTTRRIDWDYYPEWPPREE